MLQELELSGVGPAPELCFDFGSRINVVTGDNGVGKSFVLDVTWWAMTRTWAGHPANPERGMRLKPSIRFLYRATGKPIEQTSEFDYQTQAWRRKPGRPANPGMVIYARADGGFSVWDPARNYWKNAPSRDVIAPDRPEAYHFSSREVWEGLEPDGKHLCNGLIADWVSWQKEDGIAFSQLTSVLDVLSSDAEPLRPGRPMRISLEDVRDIPTLQMPYGTVPLVYASAGMRRIAALAYLLVWTWQEHQRASELLQQDPTREITFLVDEIEAHLHPRWQRVILPALLKVMQRMTQTQSAKVQILVATHAPLLLASIEPIFDEERDRVFTFDVEGSHVSLRQVSWAKQGDAVNWLVSEVFGLKQARSREAERAIEAAEAYMRGDLHDLPDDLSTWESIDQELKRVLAGHDPFWPRWIVKAETRGALRA